MHAAARTTPGPQHLQALERANAVRLARAELKRRVAAGELSVAAVIADPPWQADSMSVADLLGSQRRWGSTRCRKFLTSLGIPETKPVGTLTDRQRQAIARALRAPAPADEATTRRSARTLVAV